MQNAILPPHGNLTKYPLYCTSGAVSIFFNTSQHPQTVISIFCNTLVWCIMCIMLVWYSQQIPAKGNKLILFVILSYLISHNSKKEKHEQSRLIHWCVMHNMYINYSSIAPKWHQWMGMALRKAEMSLLIWLYM